MDLFATTIGMIHDTKKLVENIIHNHSESDALSQHIKRSMNQSLTFLRWAHDSIVNCQKMENMRDRQILIFDSQEQRVRKASVNDVAKIVRDHKEMEELL